MHISTWGNTHTQTRTQRNTGRKMLFCTVQNIHSQRGPERRKLTPRLSFLPPLVTVEGTPLCHHSHRCHLPVIPGQSIDAKCALEQWPVSAGSSSYRAGVPPLCSRLNMKLVLTRSAMWFHSCTESQVVYSQNLKVLAAGIPINADQSPPCLHLGALKAAKKKPLMFCIWRWDFQARTHPSHSTLLHRRFFLLKYLILMLCPLLLSSQTFNPSSFPPHIPQRRQIPLFSSRLKMKGRKAVFVYSLASYPPRPPFIQRESTKSLFSAYSKVQSCKKTKEI